MFDSDSLRRLVLILPLILFSLSVHEFAHGLVAYWLGDLTAKQQGRLRLNPLAHLDPFGAIMLLISSMTGFGFGWAKPVPIDPRNFHQPLKGMVFVSLAGPASNILVAFLLGLPLRFIPQSALTPQNPLISFLSLGILMNLGLAIFNLIPIPPLDGSRVVLYFLRGRAFELFIRMEQYGFLILFAILFMFRDFLGIVVGIPLSVLTFIITGLNPLFVQYLVG